jgi:hypothetical protein
MLVMHDPLHSSFRIDGKIIRQVNRDLSAGGQGTQWLAAYARQCAGDGFHADWKGLAHAVYRQLPK